MPDLRLFSDELLTLAFRFRTVAPVASRFGPRGDSFPTLLDLPRPLPR
jgi:hypothetical protein